MWMSPRLWDLPPPSLIEPSFAKHLRRLGPVFCDPYLNEKGMFNYQGTRGLQSYVCVGADKSLGASFVF